MSASSFTRSAICWNFGSLNGSIVVVLLWVGVRDAMVVAMVGVGSGRFVVVVLLWVGLSLRSWVGVGVGLRWVG